MLLSTEFRKNKGAPFSEPPFKILTAAMKRAFVNYQLSDLIWVKLMERGSGHDTFRLFGISKQAC